MPSFTFPNFFIRLRRSYHALPLVFRHWLQRVLRVTGIVLTAYVVIGLIIALPVYRGSESKFVLALEKPYPYPALIINKTVIPLSRYRLEVSARQTYANTHNLTSTPQETRQFVIDQLTARTLYAQELVRQKVVITDGDVDQKLNEIYDQVGGKEKLSQFLAQNYGSNVTLSDFRIWIYESLVEAAVKQQLLVHATVRHILVAVAEGADQATVDAAKAKATSIKAKITDVTPFADVAKENSEDMASREKGGELGTTPHGDTEPVFSAEFESAIFTLPVGQVSDPVRSKYGWHIILVEQREGKVDLSAKQLIDKLKAEGSVRVLVKTGS